MADNPRPATDLLDDPIIQEGDIEELNEVEGVTPFDKAYGALMTTAGPRLEMLSRTTPRLAVAIARTFNRIANYGSIYQVRYISTEERLSVSMDGKGRAEMIQALQAGAGVPGEFYAEGATRTSAFSDDVPDD